MKNNYLAILLFSISLLCSCKNTETEYNSNDNQNGYENEDIQEAYPDGDYCADIDYYNPDTGTSSTYTLNVEVENNELTVIHWPNGGWLDDSHFSPEELDDNGYCSFTSDRGYEYKVRITGSPCNYTDDYQARNDSEDEIAAISCPKCGGDKESYEEICYSCKRKQKDIEEHTCKLCGEHDSFMWSSDDLCSDCKRKEEDKKREEEN